ncbi:MAG: hypothetical protein HC892_13045 [Saprospiraceae bacterium]|nr:hypothetical protein [Saprospiraceae bacterium]
MVSTVVCALVERSVGSRHSGCFFQYRYGIFSFLAAFTAVALLWLGVAYWINSSHPDLADKISTILGGIGDVALLLITALLGGLSAGMGAWTATMGRKLVVN